MQASPLAVIVLDSEGKVKHWSEAAEIIFGWAEAEVLARPFPAVTKDKPDEFQTLCQSALGGESISDLEIC